MSQLPGRNGCLPRGLHLLEQHSRQRLHYAVWGLGFGGWKLLFQALEHVLEIVFAELLYIISGLGFEVWDS